MSFRLKELETFFCLLIDAPVRWLKIVSSKVNKLTIENSNCEVPKNFRYDTKKKTRCLDMRNLITTTAV